MRLLTFTQKGSGPLIGIRTQDQILDISLAAKISGESNIPPNMKALLAAGPECMGRVRHLNSDALTLVSGLNEYT